MTFILSQMILEYSQEPFCIFNKKTGFFLENNFCRTMFDHFQNIFRLLNAVWYPGTVGLSVKTPKITKKSTF